MLNAGISINVIRDGRKVFVVEIKDLSIQFLRSNNYFQGDEFQLANMFEIPNKKIFFPFRVKHHEECNQIPNLKDYYDFKDTETQREEKRSYVHELKQNNSNWIFDKELVFYAEEKVRLLSIAFLKLIEESFILQTQLKEENSQKDVFIERY